MSSGNREIKFRARERTKMGRKNGMISIFCPYCLGRGTVLAKRGIPDEDKKRMLALRRQGLTLREIAGKFKIKHPQSVKSAIETYVKGQIKRRATNV